MESSQELLNTLEGIVDRLKVIYKENSDNPLNDNVAEVRHLCICVEEVLRHQQKEKVSFWGGQKDYWNFLSEVVSKMKSLDGCVRRVQGLPQLTTGQGKGRALIRECLTEQLLADCIQNSLSNTRRTREWYNPSSILLTESLTQRMLNALYDLSDVTFDLSSEAIDLDETWPSFVLKSFQNHNGTPEGPSPSSASSSSSSSGVGVSPLLKALGGSTQVARVAHKEGPKLPLLERAIEEEPSEVYVRQEIPFNLELVGTLLADIRDKLTTPFISQGDHTPFQPQAVLPQLRVSKMDDITSCLDLLRDYVTSWSRDVCSTGVKLVEENRALQDKQADLEMQLQETIEESENAETDLIGQLQTLREKTKTFSSDMQRVVDENQRLTADLGQAREKVRELEALNFDLEEQLVRCSSAEREERERERTYTIIECSLQEKEEEVSELQNKLSKMESETQQLQRDLSDARTSLQNQAMVHEVHRRSEESLRQLRLEMTSLAEREEGLNQECSKLRSQNESLSHELEQMRLGMEQEVVRRLELESSKWGSLEQERDQMKAELEAASSLVEDATTSLKFELSSQNIELQQVKEHCSKKDRAISDLRHVVKGLEAQKKELSARCEGVEEELEVLRLEVRERDRILANNQEEMNLLNEQLTEKTSSRDLERERMLKSQLEWDSSRLQLSAEKADLKRQVEQLTNENEEIRRALKKLLEQKVTLWQHADDLEQEQIAMATWLDSKTITDCMNCNLTFTIFARKHHCRSCGKVFCGKCCEKRLQLAVSKDLSRVCDTCYLQIQQKRTPMASSMINDLEALRVSNRSPALQGEGSATSLASRHSTNSLNIERTIDLSGNSLQAKLLVQNQDLELDPDADSSSNNNTNNNGLHTHSYPSSLHHLNRRGREDEGGEGDSVSSSSRSLTSTLRIPSKVTLDGSVEAIQVPATAAGATSEQELASSYRSVNSMEYSVDPETLRREAEMERAEREKLTRVDREQCSIEDTDYCISSVQGETIDESYYLIETQPQGDSSFPMGLDEPGAFGLDVNALASKLATLEERRAGDETEASIADRRRLSTGSGRVGRPEMTEEVLEGGGVHRVPVRVEKLGTAIVWEFSTEPKGIAFGLCYKERKESSKEEEVLPLKRCVSHKATLTGEYCAQKKGVYVLKFDNCHSKYSGRKLLYKVWTRAPH